MFRSGNAAVDRYVAEGYETVRGMSSRFAATICGHIIRRQSELGIAGDVAEVGTFEGRFFIAMARLISAFSSGAERSDSFRKCRIA